MTTLKEMLNMQPLPYKWISDDRAIFKFNDQRYGIFVEYLTLELPTRSIDIANVAFGIIIGSQFKQASDVNTDLTNFGKPRTIMSTIAEACLENNNIVDATIIALAPAEQKKDQRIILYSLALAEIRQKDRRFDTRYDIRVIMPNGSKVVLISKTDFSDDEKEHIADKLEITK